MTTRAWLGASGLLIALQACEGGQTGQPASYVCRPDEANEGFGCCRPANVDERLGDWSPREIIAAHASVTDVPLFWSKIPDRPEEVFSFEPERETRLNVTLALDETVVTHACYETGLYVPINATIATDDGFHAEFPAMLAWGVDRPENVVFWPSPEPGSPARGALASYQPAVGDTDCWPYFESRPDALVGRFCDADRGIALFPTACGGIAQLPPSEAPYPPLEAPSDFLASFEPVTLTFEGLPPITLSVTLDDPSACYLDANFYYVDVDCTVETGGVSFTGNAVIAYVVYTDDESNRNTTVQSLEFCGDVSASAEWQNVEGAPSAGARLCIGFGYRKAEDGSVVYSAEAGFEGAAVGWVFHGP